MRLHSDPLKSIDFATKEGQEIYTKHYVQTNLKFSFDKYFEDMYKESLNESYVLSNVTISVKLYNITNYI